MWSGHSLKDALRSGGESALRPAGPIFPAFENLIVLGLAKDRTERPSSAQVFRAELLQIARDYRRQNAAAERNAPTLRRAPALRRVLAASQPAPGRRRRYAIPIVIGTAILTVVANIRPARHGRRVMRIYKSGAPTP